MLYVSLLLVIPAAITIAFWRRPTKAAVVVSGNVSIAPKETERVVRPVAGEFGIISGSVIFTGQVPERRELPRQADAFCASKSAQADEVIVNDNRTLKDVLVRIAPGTVRSTLATPLAPVVLWQQDCMYVPHVQGAVVGQPLEIENRDRTMHNVHAYAEHDTLLNQGQPAASPPIRRKHLPTEPTVLKFKCDIHPWMTAFVVVTDHPFFATTGTEGTFRLERVPAGTYEVEAWHSMYGTKTALIAVEPGNTVNLDFSFYGNERAAE
jgi:plastocyanin